MHAPLPHGSPTPGSFSQRLLTGLHQLSARAQAMSPLTAAGSHVLPSSGKTMQVPMPVSSWTLQMAPRTQSNSPPHGWPTAMRAAQVDAPPGTVSQYASGTQSATEQSPPMGAGGGSAVPG